MDRKVLSLSPSRVNSELLDTSINMIGGSANAAVGSTHHLPQQSSFEGGASMAGSVSGGAGGAGGVPPPAAAPPYQWFAGKQPVSQREMFGYQPGGAGGVGAGTGGGQGFEGMDAGPSGDAAATVGTDDKRKEIYGFNAPFQLFSSGWSHAADPQRKFRLAVSSFLEEYSNKVCIVQLDEEAGELVQRSQFDHPYPATKIMWIPDDKGNYPDLLATSGDYLRIWRVGADNAAQIEVLLHTNRTAEYCAPLTSFDWNEVDMNLIGTSSIDTTCTIWQLETGQAVGQTRATGSGGGAAATAGRVGGSVRTQMIAHDKEVFDIAFSRSNRDVFASVGADGSVRMFDLRQLEHSTIIYEDQLRTPLLRLAWNRQDNHYLATFAQNSNEVKMLDTRVPCVAVATLANHRAVVNGVSWAPHSSCHICTAGDDAQALIWDINNMPKTKMEDPILAYQAGGEVNQVHWSSSFSDWISICYGNRLEILRV